MKHDDFKISEKGDLSNFKVPEGYFDNFSLRINQLIDETEKVSAKENEIYTKKGNGRIEKLRPILYYAAAAVVILFFSITAVVKYKSKPETNIESTLVSKNTSGNNQQEVTAEDYLISTVGTYGIAEYYVDPKYFE